MSTLGPMDAPNTNTDSATTRGPLRSFLHTLDPNLSARAMLAAASRAGYTTTISSIYAARTALGVAKSRNNHERKTAPKQALPLSVFNPPSDEAILEHLIVKMGLDEARKVFDRVMRLAECVELD